MLGESGGGGGVEGEDEGAELVGDDWELADAVEGGVVFCEAGGEGVA